MGLTIWFILENYCEDLGNIFLSLSKKLFSY
jgi:hypothetical protein